VSLFGIPLQYHPTSINKLHHPQQADVNAAEPKHGYRPLHYAAWNGMLVSAGLLIEAQADVNAADSYGRTPLLLSARMGLTSMAGLAFVLLVCVHCCGCLGVCPPRLRVCLV
jgi:hypothetical protein